MTKTYPKRRCVSPRQKENNIDAAGMSLRPDLCQAWVNNFAKEKMKNRTPSYRQEKDQEAKQCSVSSNAGFTTITIYLKIYKQITLFIHNLVSEVFYCRLLRRENKHRLRKHAVSENRRAWERSDRARNYVG